MHVGVADDGVLDDIIPLYILFCLDQMYVSIV